MLQQALVERTQEPSGPSDPVSQHRTVERDALPGVDLGLAIERQMVRILPHDDVGDQGFSRQTTLDQTRRCRHLHHRAWASPASILGSADHQDPELGRDHIQSLGHIFADGIQDAATAGAGLALDIDDGLNPRQALGQCAAVDPAPRRAR